jgi:hypothetical protein
MLGIARFAAFVTLTSAAPLSSLVQAQDIAGTWQGTMQTGQGASKPQRILVKISKSTDGAWQGIVYNLDSDMAYEGRATTGMSLHGAGLQFAIAPIGASYQGKLSEDGATLAGTWTQSSATYLLNLARATGDAAWEIPRPDAPMAKDANPDWDVLTVKARDPNDIGNGQSTGMKGRQFVIVNRTVEGMILFACGVHKKQIVGAPSWIEK